MERAWSSRKESTSFEKSRLIDERCRILENGKKLVQEVLFFTGVKEMNKAQPIVDCYMKIEQQTPSVPSQVYGEEI